MSAPANVFSKYCDNIFQFKNGKTTKIEINKTTSAKSGRPIIDTISFNPDFTVTKFVQVRNRQEISQNIHKGPMTAADCSLLLTNNTIKFYSEGEGNKFIVGNVTYVTNCFGLGNLSMHDKVFVYFALFVISFDKGLKTFSFVEFKKALHSYRGVCLTSPVHAVLAEAAALLISKCPSFAKKKFNKKSNKTPSLVACSNSVTLPDDEEEEELLVDAAVES